VATLAQLEVGYVARAHGLHGELGVKTFDPASEDLFDVDTVVLRFPDGKTQTHSVKSTRQSAKEILLTLKNVSGRTAAEACVGSTVLVLREELAPPAEGEFFSGDLIGLLAQDASGKPLGTVVEVQNFGPVPNLVIRQEGQEELVVPFAEPFVGEVELKNNRVTVQVPEYLE